MKIFKNKVGRPSNATIRNRRILCSSIIVVIVIFIGLIVINKDKIFNLKGATSNVKINITYDCDSITGGNTCKNVGYKVTASQNVKIKYRLGWGKLSGYTTAKSKSFGNLNIDNVKELSVIVYDTKGKALASKTETFKQNGYKGKAYYYDQTNYGESYCGGSTSIAISGCGGTSMAMAMSTLLRAGVYTPTVVSRELVNYGCGANGTTSRIIRNYLSNKGFNVEGYVNYYEAENPNTKKDSQFIINKIKSALKQGAQVMVNADEKRTQKNKGCFTTTGHWMNITGISNDGNSIYLHDPNNGDSSNVNNNSGCSFNRKRNGWWKISDFFKAGGITSNGEFTAIIISNKKKNLTLNCPKQGSVNEKIKCTVNQVGVNIRVAPEEGLSSGNPVFVTNVSDMSKSFTYNKATEVTVKAVIDNQVKTSKIKIIDPKKPATVTPATTNKKLTLNCTKTATIGEKINCKTNMAGVTIRTSHVKKLSAGYKEKRTTTSSNYNVPFSYKESGTYYIEATKTGYTRVQVKVKILKNLNQYITCPSEVYVNKEFECKVNSIFISGVKFRGSYKNELAKGYSISDTGRSKKFKYTKARTVYIEASKSGYETVKKKVVVKAVNSSSANNVVTTKKTLSFTCPSNVTVGEKIVCTTNTAGVTIRTSNPEALVSGYTEKFVTTNYDKTKSLSYTKPGTYYVKASKAGYNEVKKTIKVIAKASNSSGSLVLTCPSTVYLNEPILCTTNMVGVTIRTSNPEGLSSGISDKFVTNSTDLSKSLKYIKTGTYYVKASKAGYGDVVRTIVVKRRTTQTSQDKASLAGIWFSASLSGSSKTKTIKIKPTKYGSQVKNDSYVMCETYSDCINGNAWNNMEKKYSGTQNPTTNRNIARVNKTESLWINTSYKGIANKKYYLRITTYSNDNASNWLYVGVFEFAVDSKNNVKIKNVSNKYR